MTLLGKPWLQTRAGTILSIVCHWRCLVDNMMIVPGCTGLQVCENFAHWCLPPNGSYDIHDTALEVIDVDLHRMVNLA